MTYEELIKDARAKLTAAGVTDAALDAWYMAQKAGELGGENMYMVLEKKVPEKAVRKFNKMLKLRLERIPLQHILGDTEFMGLIFEVNEHVLVPRQDTERLVEQAMEYWHSFEGTDRKLRLLDMCTGSGCIAVSLAYYGSWADITASDISAEALETAKRNAARYKEPVEFVESDLFSALEGQIYDLIVSNPPYIPTAEIETLMPEVRDHDPKIALDGGEDGLDFYRRLASEAPAHLTDDGVIMLEIGAEQAEAVKEIFTGAGFADVKIVKDYADNDRVAICRR